MSKGCVIHYDNPVTGKRHPSVLGYTLTQAGLDQDFVEDLLSNRLFYKKTAEGNSWGALEGKNKISSYREPSAKEYLPMVGVSVTPTYLNYISTAQEFFDSFENTIDTPIGFQELTEYVNRINQNADLGLPTIVLEIVPVNPDAPVSERTYKVYPIMPTINNAVGMNERYNLESLNRVAESSETSEIGFISKYVNPANPDIYDTIQRVIKDEDVPLYQKEALTRMLPLLHMLPEIGFDFQTLGYLYDDQGNKKAVVGGKYDTVTNKILLSPYALSRQSDDANRKLLIHELSHAITLAAFLNPITATDKKFADRVQKIFDSYKQNFQIDPTNPTHYGFTDPSEMISEFIANPDFRAILQQQSPEAETSMWKAIWNYLLNALGFVKQGKLDTSIQALDAILNDYFNEVLVSNSINTSLIGNTISPNYGNYVLTPDQIAQADYLFDDSSDFLTRLDALLSNENLIDWRFVFQEAENVGINTSMLYTSEKEFKEIGIDDAKKSFISLAGFFHETAKYLRGVSLSLDNLKANKHMPAEELFRKSYHARQLGEQYTNFVNAYQEIMGDLGNNTVLNIQLKNIRETANSLVQDHFNTAVTAIAKKLATEFAPQTEALRKEIEGNINTFEKELEKAVAAKDTRLERGLKDKIAEEKAQLNKIASEVNLIKALTGKIKDINNFTLYLEAASMSSHLLGGTIGGMIANMFDEANVEAMQLERAMKDVARRLQNHLRSKGIGLTTSLSFEEAFGRFSREVEVYEIKRGKLEKRKTIVFNTEMDEIAFTNDKIKLDHEIRQLQSKKKLTPEEDAELDRLLREYDNLEEEYKELPYTQAYYDIQNLLTEEARDARETIISEMRKIQANGLDQENSEEELTRLDQLKFELDRLESDYDELGNKKDEEGLRIAKTIRDWKQARNAAELLVYEITPENRAIFLSQYKQQKDLVDKARLAYEEASSSPDTFGEEEISSRRSAYESKLKKFILWKKNNTVVKISQDFYKKRREVTDRISEIQSANAIPGIPSITELYDEIFNLLKGYKDNNGYYRGDILTESEDLSIVNQIKALETRIEQVKEIYSENANLSKETKEILNGYFAQLDSMQKRVNTPYYQKIWTNKMASIRSKLVAKNASKYEGQSSNELLEVDAIKELKTTEWYKENHKKVTKFNPNTNKWEDVDVPLFIWTTIEPTDPSYMSETEPSFRWTTIKINDKVDPVTKQPVFIRPEIKESTFSKRVLLRKDKAKYKNPAYSQLDSVERGLLEEVLTIYANLEKTVPRNLKKGLEFPSVPKSALEGAKGAKMGNMINQIVAVGEGWKNSLFGKDDVAGPRDDEGSMIKKVNRRLFLRYNSPIPADEISRNFLNTITQYGADVIRFKKAYEQIPYIFGIQDVIRKNMPGSKIEKLIEATFERHLQGQTRKYLSDNKYGKMAENALTGNLSIGAMLALAYRLPSTIKNFGAGTANLFIQLKAYGLEEKDVRQAMVKNSRHIIDLFKSYIEDGQDSPYISTLRYFNAMPGDHLLSTGKNISVTKLEKYTKTYNPLYWLSFGRDFGEFQMRSAAMEALSQKYRVTLQDGREVAFLDAYVPDSQGNLQIRDDVESVEDVKALEGRFRGELNLINYLVQGAYGVMDKAEYQRYSLGRLIGHMKGWFVAQSVRRFGGRRINYRAGKEYEGLFRVMVKYMKYVMQQRFSFPAAWKLMSNRERAEFISGMYDTAVLATLMGIIYILNSIRYGDDEEENLGALYMLLYTLLLIEDELNTLNPVAGPLAIYNARVKNQVNGQNIVEYYLSRNFVMPFSSVIDIIKLADNYTLGMFTDTDLDMFGEYVPLSRNGKILNPKRYPPDPLLKGQRDIAARLEKLIGLDVSTNYLMHPEYIFRKYEERNERYYISTLDKEIKDQKKTAKSVDKQVSAIDRQLGYIEDQETIQGLLDTKEKLLSEKREALEKQQQLRAESMNPENLID